MSQLHFEKTVFPFKSMEKFNRECTLRKLAENLKILSLQCLKYLRLHHSEYLNI